MKQSTALDILKTGSHVFLTGQAGAGKTYVLNQYINYLRAQNVPVAVTASTGIAATHMNGMTVHSWAGIGIKDELVDSDLMRLSKREHLVERLKHVRVLIIDEVSMLHARQLDLVDKVLRHFRRDDAPFGGVQVVFSGDFFQLPPIGKKGETTQDKFAFMSKAWITLANQRIDGMPVIKVCYLDEQHRQNEDDGDKLGLNDILNQIREQAVSAAAIDTLTATGERALDMNRTRLYTHNAKVDEINESELAAIDAPITAYQAVRSGDEDLCETLKKSVRAPETLELKVGAKVMFVKNNSSEHFYNGTMGIVRRFVQAAVDGETVTLPEVELNDGRRIIVNYDTWSIIDEDDVPLASYSQIPLCLAWAITVHKSQGMTLDAAEVDLSKTFENGQGYVALSRIKSLKGLKLLGINKKSLQLDEFAQVANRRFLALSEECAAWLQALPKDTLIAQQAAFLKRSAHAALAEIIEDNDDATTTPKCDLEEAYIAAMYGAPSKPPITKHNQNKNKSSDTQNATLTLVQAGKSLDDIAFERSLAKSTIIEHLTQLVQKNTLSLDDIRHLLPSAETIKKVKSAVDTLNDSDEFINGIKLRPIYDELRETVSYHDIRLALLALDRAI